MWRSILSQHYKVSTTALDNRSRILYCIIIISVFGSFARNNADREIKNN